MKYLNVAKKNSKTLHYIHPKIIRTIKSKFNVTVVTKIIIITKLKLNIFM